MSGSTGSAWRWQAESLPGGSVITAALTLDDRRANVDEVLAGWRQDRGFRQDWSRWLADIPLSSYCWEMPPLTADRLAQPFECVFVESPALAIPQADPAAFAEFFPLLPSQQDAVTFANLGGDALLVAPTPQANPEVYPHLAKFVRAAPASQVASIWQAVAAAVEGRIGEDPLWLSTAGLGVAWLHVRLDSRPKYYRYRPYARMP